MANLPAGVSFLICTYNGVSRIGETLACLAQQVANASIEWEVILVDNACTDGTSVKAESCWQQLGAPKPLRIFYEPRPGKNFAVELAFTEASYSYTCIVDDDNRLDANYLETGYSLLQAHAQIGILGGPNSGSFEINPPAWFPLFQGCYAVGKQFGYENGQLKPLTDGNINQNVLWGAGMFVRTNLWHQLRNIGFKSLFSGRQGTKNLTAGEDDELCYVAQMLDYEVWYSSRLHLWHYMTSSRLTQAYRNKLFYSSVWGQTRIQAYIRGLNRGQTKKLTTINLAKDFAYMTKGVVLSVFSRRYLQAVLSRNTIVLMETNRQILIWYDFSRSFNKIKEYNRIVSDLKARIGESYYVNKNI